jgi:ribonuclease T
MSEEITATTAFAERFRGYLPVIVDVETGGFKAATDALLEIAAVTLDMDDDGILHIGECLSFNVQPFEGANIEAAALEFTGIKLDDSNRQALPEMEAMSEIFTLIRKKIKRYDCKRAILVGHNAHFDLGFVQAAAARTDAKRNPFHPFSCFDTATLAGLAFGHTVLAKSCQIAGIEFSNREAHNARYDALKTAELFCLIVNRWQQLGGWPIIRSDLNPFEVS